MFGDTATWTMTENPSTEFHTLTLDHWKLLAWTSKRTGKTDWYAMVDGALWRKGHASTLAAAQEAVLTYYHKHTD